MTSGKKLAAKVEDFADDLDDNIDEGLQDGMENTEFETTTNIRENDSVVNRGLISSVNLYRDTIPSAHKSASVRIEAGHAPFVEYGTGSMQQGGPLKFKAPDPRPPLGPIKQWLIRKGDSIPRDPNLREFGEINIDQQQSLTNLAKAIADQIGKYGNRPHPYARPAAQKGFDTTVDNVRRQMQHSIRRF